LPSDLLIEIVIIILCILASGLFSGSETALMSLSEARLNRLREDNPLGGQYLVLWHERPALVLASILVGNNIVNILASALATDLSARCLELAGFDPRSGTVIGLAVGVMTLAILVFGEVLPKTWARHNAERMLVVLPFLLLAFALTWPLAKLLSLASGGLVRLGGGSLSPNGPRVTEEEIEFMIQKGTEEGSLDAEKEAMLTGVFELDETMAREIMVARTDLVGFDVSASLEEVLGVIDEKGFSRYPVYHETVDEIVGVFYARDLIPYLRSVERKPFELKQFLRTPCFVPTTKRLDQLLKEFQRDKVHIAIVVDEHGGTAGVVTLEDVIEEMVGEIYDEYDRAEDLFLRDPDGTFRVRAKLSVYDLAEELDMELPELEDVDTVGGLLNFLAGQVPKKGQELTWQVPGRDRGHLFRFTVLEADRVRVRLIRLRIEAPAA